MSCSLVFAFRCANQCGGKKRWTLGNSNRSSNNNTKPLSSASRMTRPAACKTLFMPEFDTQIETLALALLDKSANQFLLRIHLW